MAYRGKLKAISGGADFRVVTSTRRLAILCCALVTIVATMAPPARAAEEPQLEIEGGGWGHGIGMSQYGAYGQALDGKTAEQIVGYYYQGSSTGQIVDQVGTQSFIVTDPKPLWVGLLTNRSVFRFQAVGGNLKACQAGAGCELVVKPGEEWRFEPVGDGTCRYTKDGVEAAPAGECKGHVRGLRPAGAHIKIPALDSGRDEFARGIVKIRTPDGGNKLHVALEIALEEYLYGLAEMPFSWHIEALRAQALAGRSYATWRLVSRGPEASFSADRKATCWCHMYATTADQAYSGWANEAAAGADKWRSAVDTTAGKVITHAEASQANIVAAFYSSSTGGRTENVEDMWGGGPVDYLRSKADHWSQAPEVNNPFGTWNFEFNEAQLAAPYGFDKLDGIEIVERFASGTPSLVTIHGRDNGKRVTESTNGAGLFSTYDLRGRNVRALHYGNISGVAGDFNGDGRGDVAMVTPVSSTWWVGRSTPGTFTEVPWMNHSSNAALDDLVSGDFNGDGQTDVAARQQGTGRLLVGIAGKARFQSQLWANHANPNKWQGLLVGDFDGDGRDDLAEYDTTEERWRVYRLEGAEVVKEFWYDFAVSNPNWAAFAAGDYNGDGRDDILSLDANTGDLIVLFSNGSSFAPSGWQTLPNDGEWQFVQAADFDGNGRDDLAAYDPSAGTWWVVKGLAGDRGAVPQLWFAYVNKSQTYLDQVAGDFTGDGKADIVAYLPTTGRLKVLISDGVGFRRGIWGRVPARANVTQIMVTDFNNDGRDDVVAWNNSKRRWWGARSAGNDFVVTRWGRLL